MQGRGVEKGDLDHRQGQGVGAQIWLCSEIRALRIVGSWESVLRRKLEALAHGPDWHVGLRPVFMSSRLQATCQLLFWVPRTRGLIVTVKGCKRYKLVMGFIVHI